MFSETQIIGNLGSDVEVIHGKVTFAKFSLAENRYVKGEEITVWWNIVVFGDSAEKLADHIGKGDTVRVAGKVEVNQWTQKDGTARADLVLTTNYVMFLRTKPRGDREQAAPSTHSTQKSNGYQPEPATQARKPLVNRPLVTQPVAAAAFDLEDDDIPF